MQEHKRAEQRMGEENVRQANLPAKMLVEGGKMALPFLMGAGGAAVASKIVPLLSNYIPANLAVKGLSKINPRLGKFFKGIGVSGYSIKEGLNFLRSKLGIPEVEEEEEEEQNPMTKDEALKQFNSKRKKSMLEEEIERFERGYGSQQEQAPLNSPAQMPEGGEQSQNVDSALLAALQKILSM